MYIEEPAKTREPGELILRKQEYGLILRLIIDGNKTPTDIWKAFKSHYPISYDELTHKLTNITTNYFHFLKKEKPGKITRYSIDYKEMVLYMIQMINKELKDENYSDIREIIALHNIPYDPEFILVQKKLKSFIKSNPIGALFDFFNRFIDNFVTDYPSSLVGKPFYFQIMAMLEANPKKEQIFDDIKKGFPDLQFDSKNPSDIKELISNFTDKEFSDEEILKLQREVFTELFLWIFSRAYMDKRKIIKN